MPQSALRLVENELMDKQKALDAALGQIERAFGKGSVMKLGQRENVVEVDVEIPPEHYKAVAGAISYVWSLEGRMAPA